MNLHAMLLKREAAGRPVTVGVIGAGKFGTMFLAQARTTRGMHVVAVADPWARQETAAHRRLGGRRDLRSIARRRMQGEAHACHAGCSGPDRMSWD